MISELILFSFIIFFFFYSQGNIFPEVFQFKSETIRSDTKIWLAEYLLLLHLSQEHCVSFERKKWNIGEIKNKVRHQTSTESLCT